MVLGLSSLSEEFHRFSHCLLSCLPKDSVAILEVAWSLQGSGENSFPRRGVGGEQPPQKKDDLNAFLQREHKEILCLTG